MGGVEWEDGGEYHVDMLSLPLYHFLKYLDVERVPADWGMAPWMLAEVPAYGRDNRFVVRQGG